MMRDTRLVVGLVGATGSGKTTVARGLVARAGFVNVHMGRPIKDMLLALGLTDQQVAGSPEDRARALDLLGGRSARFALSTLGTNWGRNMITPDLWANAVKMRLEAHFADTRDTPVIIDDLRFPNDWAVVQSFGGVLLRIRRPSAEVSRRWSDHLYHRLNLSQLHSGERLLGWRPMHETEFHWPDAPASADVANNGAPELVIDAVLDALRLQGRWPLQPT